MGKHEIAATIRNFCKAHNLPVDQFILGHDAAAVMLGFKDEVDEIYVDVPDATLNYVWCLEAGVNRPSIRGGTGCSTLIDGIGIHSWITDGCLPTMIEGVQVVGKERLIDQLTWRCRWTADPVQHEEDKAMLSKLTGDAGWVATLTHRVTP